MGAGASSGFGGSSGIAQSAASGSGGDGVRLRDDWCDFELTRLSSLKLV